MYPSLIAPASTPPRLSTLVLLTALSVLSLNMFLPSLSSMAVSLNTEYAVINLSIAGYLAVTAVLQLVIGPISDRFGRRPVLLAALGIFILASFGCVLTNHVGWFLAFRMFQGAIIAGAVLSAAVIRDTVPPREAASQIGYVSMAMAVAPMLGPMLGGVLDQAFGWRASFLLFCGLGMMLFAQCWVDLGETHQQRSSTFSGQFRTYPALLRSGRYWGYALCIAFSTGAFYAFISGVPLVAAATLSLSPTVLGLGIGSITGGFMFGSFLSGRLARRYPLTTMMLIGRVVACTGLSIGLLLFAFGTVTTELLFGATLFVGIGNGLTMPSAKAGALSVRPELAGSASGLAGGLTVGAGAILTSFTGAYLSETHGATQLLAIMLTCSVLGLIAALYVARADGKEERASH